MRRHRDQRRQTCPLDAVEPAAKSPPHRDLSLEEPGLKDFFLAHTLRGGLDIDRFVAAQASLARALGATEDRVAAAAAFVALSSSADGKVSPCEAFCKWQVLALRARGIPKDRMAEAFRRSAAELSAAPAKAARPRAISTQGLTPRAAAEVEPKSRARMEVERARQFEEGARTPQDGRKPLASAAEPEPKSRARMEVERARKSVASEAAESRGVLLSSQQLFRDLAERGRTAPEEFAGSLASLASYLVKDAQTDEQRAWVLYAWVCNHIDYDVDGLRGHRPMRSCRPEDVLKSRLSVCAGYASIFEMLATEVGLTVRQVSGHARNISRRVDQDIVRENAGAHAWNAVKLGKEWILIDCTWGAGTTGQFFERNFRPHFFGTPPKQLAFTHFPEEPEWQLMQQPVSYAEFISQPIVETGGFFGHRLEFVPYRPSGTVKTRAGEQLVQLRMPADASLLIKLCGQKLDYKTAANGRDASSKMAQISVPKGTTGSLSIFVRWGGPYGNFEYACEVSVKDA